MAIENNKRADREVLITRIFDAPRELVFEAWTNPEHLGRWYAPKGCTIRFITLEIREGGSFHSCIHNPLVGDCWCRGIYHEISFPERIVYSLALADESGNLSDTGLHPGWPAETLVTVTFEECEGKTKLSLHQAVSETFARQTGAYSGWVEMLDHLEKELTQSPASLSQ